MIEGVPRRLKIIFMSLVAAIFICSVAFAFVFVIDGSMAEDESRAFTFALIFAVVFIALNAVMLLTGYMIFRKAREQSMKKCVSCGTLIGANAKACSKCSTIQPISADDDMYLEPKERSVEVKKKK